MSKSPRRKWPTFPAEMLASQSVTKRKEVWKEILTQGKSVVPVMVAERLEHHHLVGFSRRPVSHQL